MNTKQVIVHDTQVRQIKNNLHYPTLDYADYNEELRKQKEWRDENDCVTFNNHNMEAVQQLVDSRIGQEIRYMGNSILGAMEVLYGVEDGVAHGRTY